MKLSFFKNFDHRFRTCAEIQPLIKQACETNPDVATYHNLGVSEEGRTIDAVIMGTGPRTISLIAGAHSDEPVGPETLRTFITDGLAQKEKLAPLFTDYKFIIVPHINPDGEVKNQRWINKWPGITAYLQHVFRELPGRDLEFGFPEMRQENRLVAEFVKEHAPVDLHMSLHGMGICDGAMLLIEKKWIARTEKLREQYAGALLKSGLKLHDHDRKGEKGFQHIAPGFTTTPEGHAMRAYFKSIGEEETGGKFHDSSMEFVRKLGGDPLCLVTELPLFLIKKEVQKPQPGVPAAYLEFKKELPKLRTRLMQGEAIGDTLEEFKIEPIDLNLLVKLQLRAIELGLEAIISNG